MVYYIICINLSHLMFYIINKMLDCETIFVLQLKNLQKCTTKTFLKTLDWGRGHQSDEGGRRADAGDPTSPPTRVNSVTATSCQPIDNVNNLQKCLKIYN